MVTTPRTKTHIAVYLPDGREVTFQSGLWRREEDNALVIDSEEEPKQGERREVLAIIMHWWAFRVIKQPT